MEKRELSPCPDCGGRRVEWSGHGVFHAENGHQMCPPKRDSAKVRRLIAEIVERDAELLKRLADS